jgi:hypothetical protein
MKPKRTGIGDFIDDDSLPLEAEDCERGQEVIRSDEVKDRGTDSTDLTKRLPLVDWDEKRGVRIQPDRGYWECEPYQQGDSTGGLMTLAKQAENLLLGQHPRTKDDPGDYANCPACLCKKEPGDWLVGVGPNERHADCRLPIQRELAVKRQAVSRKQHTLTLRERRLATLTERLLALPHRQGTKGPRKRATRGRYPDLSGGRRYCPRCGMQVHRWQPIVGSDPDERHADCHAAVEYEFAKTDLRLRSMRRDIDRERDRIKRLQKALKLVDPSDPVRSDSAS